ncbi:MAG: 2-keto-3-deoxy-D-arabino-heptulosonate-7-phosphate synthase beta [Firmicutes bacterium]|nr:2-keto-3-deoxy-D-arabino-heptulosonate-7-phosphate synthase beta [Bacillota bacterium]
MPSYKLASREYCPRDTVIEIPGLLEPVFIGAGYCTIIAGPCAVENQADYLEIAKILKSIGIHILRAGLFKPRTSPYSFKGLGTEGLKIVEEARRTTGIAVLTEVMDVRDIEDLYPHIDIFQIGSRNMQNFTLLEELGKTNKPILLKRGLAATIEEWLLAAEYLLDRGNHKIILCERGIRTFEPYARNTVDIGAVPLIKHLSHLPILVDPSHATGRAEMVGPVAKAAVAAGADGILVEVHQHPEAALSDGRQSLTPEQFRELYEQINKLAELEQKILQ